MAGTTDKPSKSTGRTDLAVRQLFDWRMCNIQHITFFFVPAADVDSQRALLDDQFESAP